jgi:hypothetical protein
LAEFEVAEAPRSRRSSFGCGYAALGSIGVQSVADFILLDW